MYYQYLTEGRVRATVDAVVADFYGGDLPVLTKREQSLPALPGKADAVIGMRRSGKTYFWRAAVVSGICYYDYSNDPTTQSR